MGLRTPEQLLQFIKTITNVSILCNFFISVRSLDDLRWVEAWVSTITSCLILEPSTDERY